MDFGVFWFLITKRVWWWVQATEGIGKQNGGEGRGERKDAGEETLDLINLHRRILSDSLPPAVPISWIFHHSTQQQQQLRTTHSIHEPEEDLSLRVSRIMNKNMTRWSEVGKNPNVQYLSHCHSHLQITGQLLDMLGKKFSLHRSLSQSILTYPNSANLTKRSHMTHQRPLTLFSWRLGMSIAKTSWTGH